MAKHGDAFFIKGWSKCAEHIATYYPDIDPVFIMEPQEKARFLRWKKKAKSLGIQVKDFPTDDSAFDFKSGDDDDDDTDDAGALIS